MRVGFQQNLQPAEGEVSREEEAVFCGGHRGGAETGRGRNAGGGTDPAGGDHRADSVSVKKQYKGPETDQVRQFMHLQEKNRRLKGDDVGATLNQI